MNSENNASPPLLVIKNVPKSMQLKNIRKICELSGRVLEVRNSRKTKNVFVDCETDDDQKAIYNNLMNNHFGFTVEFGIRKKKHEVIYKNDSCKSKIPATPETINNKCENCDAIDCLYECYRCNVPFCSEKCQKEAWQVHRYFCGKPKCLQEKYAYLNRENNQITHELPIKSFEQLRDLTNFPEKMPELEYSKMVESTEFMPKLIDLSKSTDRDPDIKAENISIPFKLKLEEQSIDKCSELNKNLSKTNDNEIETSIKSKSSFESKNNSQYKNDHKFRSICVSSSKHQTPISPENISRNIKNEMLIFKLPESGTIIKIINFTKYNMISLISKNNEENEQYKQGIKLIHNNANDSKTLQSTPNVGSFATTKREEKFCRVLILTNNDKNHIKVMFVDYGDIDFKCLFELYEFPSNCIDVPLFLRIAVLKDVPDVKLNEISKKFVSNFLNCDMKLKYDIRDELPDKCVYKVELTNDKTFESLNLKLIEFYKSEQNNINQSSEDGCFKRKSHLQRKDLPTGDNIELVIINNSSLNSGRITCTTLEYALEIQRFQRFLQIYATKSSEFDYKPSIDELCIAQYSVNNKWYRGSCLELISDDYAHIFYLDYGNSEILSISKIRSYPKNFNYPIYVSDCKVAGLPKKNTDNAFVQKMQEEHLPTGKAVNFDNVKLQISNGQKLYILNLFIKNFKETKK